jgi:signal transduction histidine kinase
MTMAGSSPVPAGGSNEAAKEAFREALRAEQRAATAETALAGLRRRVVALSGAEAPAPELLEAIANRLGAARAALWRLGPSSFELAAAIGLTAPKLRFPAPHPFGQAVLPPRGWLPREGLPPQLQALRALDEQLYFVPLERHLLLLGFAILSLPANRPPDAAAFDDLDPLLALGAKALHHQWELEDISARRSALAQEVSEQRRYAQALEASRWGVTQGDRVRLEFLRFASRSLSQGLSELLILLKLGMDGAYSEEETGSAFQSATRIAHHLRSLLAEVERCTETAERTVSLEPLDPSPVLRAAKDAFERQGGSGLTWPNLWVPLPKVLGDGAILQEVLATLLGLQAFHARSVHESLRIEISAQTLRLRFPFPDLNLAPVVGALDGTHPDGPDPGGTGGPALALVVSRQLLRDLGGELRVESERGGSVVCVDLSLAQP